MTTTTAPKTHTVTFTTSEVYDLLETLRSDGHGIANRIYAAEQRDDIEAVVYDLKALDRIKALRRILVDTLYA